MTTSLLSLSLSLPSSLSLSLFLHLFFEAFETPPCVRLHSIPWAAHAWQSVLKVSRQPCPVAYIGYKLPARLLKTVADVFHSFYSNPAKVWLCFMSPSVAFPNSPLGSHTVSMCRGAVRGTEIRDIRSAPILLTHRPD